MWGEELHPTRPEWALRRYRVCCGYIADVDADEQLAPHKTRRARSEAAVIFTAFWRHRYCRLGGSTAFHESRAREAGHTWLAALIGRPHATIDTLNASECGKVMRICRQWIRAATADLPQKRYFAPEGTRGK